jgi:ammonium transporter, Amt family
MRRLGKKLAIGLAAGGLAAGVAWAAAAAGLARTYLPHQVKLELDSAGTAWMIAATALVLMMTMPGLALFYGGMVRRKNIIATITQSVAVTALVTVLWMVGGYSLAFTHGPDMPLPILSQLPFLKGLVAPQTVNDFIGGFDAVMLKGVLIDTAYSSAKGLPETLFIAYQLTFAIITPALITGAFAERMKFSAVLLFMTLWHFLVYAPVAHWVWGGGFLGSAGALDFAGGTVVHLNSGVAGLVCALFLGKRVGYGSEPMEPNSIVRVMIGASLLFVGWIGFNAGSANAADGIASMALLNTIIGACAAALSWKVVEWIERKKVSLIGILSGLVAGLVGITPAAGYVDPTGALCIGLITGVVCYVSAVWLKKLLGYDDSLDAFGIHGVGGAAGALLTGVFASVAVNSASKSADILLQVAGIAWTFCWSGAMTFIILVICKFTTGVRVAPEVEEGGLDFHLHGEAQHH